MRHDADGPLWADMYRGGMTVEQVALDAFVSPATVRRQLHRLGVEMRPAYGPPTLDSNRAAAVSHSRPHLDPAAAIVRPSVQRMYR